MRPKKKAGQVDLFATHARFAQIHTYKYGLDSDQRVGFTFPGLLPTLMTWKQN